MPHRRCDTNAEKAKACFERDRCRNPEGDGHEYGCKHVRQQVDPHQARALSAQTARGETVKTPEDYFFVKCGNKYEKILFDDILYVEGMQNYVTIYTVKGKYITMLSLKSLEENLAETAFIRVHKSFIAAISKIDGLEAAELFIAGNRIPVSRSYRDQVMERVLNKKLWDKK